MKTVMKKLLSLALVAILLVSAVPFQAAATGDGESITVPFTIKLDGADNGSGSITVNSGECFDLNEEFAKTYIKDNQKFVSWTHSEGTNGVLNYTWLAEVVGRATSCDLVLNLATICKHNYQDKRTESTCEKAGSIVHTCINEGCDYSYTEPLPLADHDYGEWTTTKVATATEAGEEKHVCTVCGHEQFRRIDPTGATTYTVTFIADGVTVKTYTWEKGQTVPNLPDAPEKKDYEFKGWYSGKNANGEQIEVGDTWNDTDITTYYAYYKEDKSGTKDGMSTLTVRMRLYTGSTLTNDVVLFSEDLKDETYILSWLQNNTSKVREAVYSKVDDSEYEWIDRVFYDNDSKAELTSQATLADGDKVVFVKVHALDSKETNVQLYIHQYDSTNKVYKTLKIVDVSGYKADDTITLSKMATIVKKSYSYTSIKGLYTNAAWSQLVNGQNPTASTSLTVSGEGTVKYHVILNGATTASSSNADKTNPKTGDMIVMPMMIMVASAAAVAYVYFGSKKRSAR